MILLAICGFGMILVLFWKKKVEKRLFFLVLCGNLLGLALTVQEGLAGKRQEVTALERGGYGEIPEEVDLEVELFRYPAGNIAQKKFKSCCQKSSWNWTG